MDPVYKNASKLLNSCSGVEEAINACHRRGKKVMLSLGGGAPTDYYLPNQDVAEWLAEFLLGAYGKPTAEWIAAGKPRPFGNAFVDGFDLDLEAQAGNMPGGKSELIYANYEFFGQYVKTHSSMLLSAAPQCIVPDARISPVLKKVAFDMVFTQFYNTWECSAAKEVDDRKNKRTGTFTFDSWIKEIKASANPNTKFYIGLPAGPAGLPTHKEHYVSPLDADFLLRFYKGNENFGGVMLWEATVSVQNPTYGQSFGTWMKKSLDGTFSNDFHPVVSSSTLSSSTRTPTPTTLSTSSTPASSTVVSSSTPISSSVMSSSTPVSSSMVSSSTPTPSTMVTSSSASSSAYATPSAESSSAYVTSSSASSSSSVHVPSSSSAVESSSVASSSSSVHESSSVYSEMPTESASSVQTASSTMIEPSSVATISASASGNESVYVPLPTETASSVQSESSSVIEPSSIPSITATITASSIETVSSTLIEPSSVATISASESASSSVYVPSPTKTPASSDMYSTGAVSATSPEAVSSTSCSTSSGAYPTGASSSDIYSSSSESTPEAASSTPYAPPTEYSMSFSVVYPSGVYSTASPAHPTETVSASKGMDYPAESSKTNAASSTSYESAPSVTKKPEHSEYSTVPAGSTTSVVTSKLLRI
jgi:chitinase